MESARSEARHFRNFGLEMEDLVRSELLKPLKVEKEAKKAVGMVGEAESVILEEGVGRGTSERGVFT